MTKLLEFRRGSGNDKTGSCQAPRFAFQVWVGHEPRASLSANGRSVLWGDVCPHLLGGPRLRFWSYGRFERTTFPPWRAKTKTLLRSRWARALSTRKSSL